MKNQKFSLLFLFTIYSCSFYENLASDFNSDSSTDESAYPWHHNALTTQFYVGEDGVEVSAFNTIWLESFGGIDHPQNRHPNNVYLPNLENLKQNPFYFALPYTDLTSSGEYRPDRVKIPWYDPKSTKRSQIKNRWIRIKHKDQVCYGQWQDCGPVNSNHLECDDFDYVFGDSPQPNNDQYGLDVSPALSYCLGMRGPGNVHYDDKTSWRFIDFNHVPKGPWNQVVTTNDTIWK